MSFVQTVRAKAIDLRTYLRPLDAEGTSFESRRDMLERSMFLHHENLYAHSNVVTDGEELVELIQLGIDGKAAVAGRTQWLGGTDYSYSRACCNFNCSFTEAATVYDLVDIAWLLLNGCGVGFKPRMGTLHGYRQPIQTVEVVKSDRDRTHKGNTHNEERLPSADNDWTWTIKVGDSAVAWAKALGKMFASPANPRRLVLDFSDIRGSGGRLKGYGWICNGYGPLADAMVVIHQILNNSSGNLLNDMQIRDVVNWFGTVLSSRRAAELCEMDAHNPMLPEFMRAKYEYWKDNQQRRQSNDTILFWSKPTKRRIEEVLRNADECGGDPAIANAEAAVRKAPWFVGFNPCAEIFLPPKGFCNVMTQCLPRFKGNFAGLERATYLMGRANYRQTCVDLEDGILQPAWHQTNQSLRLCGLSATGIVQADWLTDYQIRRLRNAAVSGAYSMADELRLPRPKAVTTLKPEGTISKTLGGLDIGEVAEGIHRPLGRYLFNWVNFSVYDPLVPALEAVGYKSIPSPADPSNVLVCFPVSYSGVRFDVVDGKEVNLEPAVSQLNRYLRWNNLWADHNVSCTISYSPEEISEVVDWLYANWDNGFVSVSFLRRNDPTKTAKDLGHPYLPQEVVTPGVYADYVAGLRDVNWSGLQGIFEITEDACPTGMCPTK